jgi:hypothetical protein
MASFGPPKKMTYPEGGDNPGQTEDQSATEPSLPGPRVMKEEAGMTAGANITDGFGYREGIHDVSTEELGMDTIGGGQVHQQMPKDAAGRKTRFG